MKKEMIKFIVQMFGYGFLFVVCAILISSFWYSFDRDFILHYEVPLVVQKHLYLQNNKGSFDTVFIGSSVTRRHIIPEQFDAITGTRSFNLGIDALRSHRIKQIVELTVKHNPDVKTIFWELRRPEREEASNYKTNQIIYAVRWHRIPIVLDWLHKSEFPEKVILNEYVVILRETLYKYIGTGIQKQILLTLGVTDAAPKVQKVNFNQFEKMLGFGTIDDPDFRGRVVLQENLAKGVHLPETYINQYRDFVFDAEKHRPDLYMYELHDYVQELERQGVRVIFVAPARMNEIRYIRKVMHYFSAWGIPVIDMMDPDKFPEFFTEPAYSYDTQHFNVAGAEVYTDRLAHEYLKFFSQK